MPLQGVGNMMSITRCAFAALFLSACTGQISHKLAEGQMPVIQGPAISDNATPFDAALRCVADKVRLKTSRRIAVTVGAVRDYTGKYLELEGGSLVTQGGSLMVISALGKMGDAINLRERFDTQVADVELGYLDKRRLGDGRRHSITEDGKQTSVPYLPYTGGSILESEVYIVGGITEVNFNVASGGAEAEIDGIGGGARTFAISVAADLRLVNSANLNVVKVVSLQKQVIGYEVRAGVFNFFGTNLFDINAGAEMQEPLQLAIRSILELGTLQLVGHMYQVDYNECLPGSVERENEAGEAVRFYSVVDEDRVVTLPSEES